MAPQNPIRFKSLLAWSSNSAAVAPGLVPSPFNWTISEQGISGQFTVDTLVRGGFQNLKHRNVNLTTGIVPMDLLHADSTTNPRLRRFVQVNDPLSIELLSTAGAAVAACGLTTAPVQGLPDYYEGDAYRDYTRSIIAFGGDQIATIAPGGSQQFTIDLAQSGQAGYVVISCASNAFLSDLYVSEMTYDNDPLLDGQNTPASMFRYDKQAAVLSGAMLETNHVFTITVRNDGAVAATDVAVCVTAG